MKKFLSAFALIICIYSQHVIAEDYLINVGLTTGSTGTNIEFSKNISEKVGLRVTSRLTGDLNRTTTLDGNEYKASFTPETKGLFVDFYPFSGSFYLSGGLVGQNINFRLTGQASGGTYEFNNTSYNQSDIGTFTGTTSFSKSIAPYLGLGWSGRNKQEAGLAYSFEAGVISVGTGEAVLNVSCGSGLSAAACNTLQADVRLEENNINNDLNKNLYYPVVLLGISYRF